jgi:hypothetical protein
LPSKSSDSKTEPSKEPSKDVKSHSPVDVTGPSDLAKAVALIDRLPLSNAEMMEAVRRLLHQ